MGFVVCSLENDQCGVAGDTQINSGDSVAEQESIQAASARFTVSLQHLAVKQALRIVGMNCSAL